MFHIGIVSLIIVIFLTLFSGVVGYHMGTEEPEGSGNYKKSYFMGFVLFSLAALILGAGWIALAGFSSGWDSKVISSTTLYEVPTREAIDPIYLVKREDQNGTVVRYEFITDESSALVELESLDVSEMNFITETQGESMLQDVNLFIGCVPRDSIQSMFGICRGYDKMLKLFLVPESGVYIAPESS